MMGEGLGLDINFGGALLGIWARGHRAVEGEKEKALDHTERGMRKHQR